MSKLLKRIHPEVSVYKDRRFEGDEAEWQRALRTSTTLYVGNLSFFTREEQVYEVFSKVGHVERIVMGLDKVQKTPCGFAFIIYYSRSEAEAAVRYLNGTVLDDRSIRVDHDWGFVEGRQWGRGTSGGQVRDEFRLDYDPGRGGFGKVVQKEIVSQYASPSGMGMPGGAKRQRMEGGHQSAPRERTGQDGGGGQDHRRSGDGRGGSGGGGRAAVEDNPRFRERKKDQSDDEDEG